MRVEVTDSDLVASSLAGDRDAFSCIVTRYQSLICSLVYSATGSLTQSEDLAQETFVAAWKKLNDLREPEKLRAWLCRIARNHIYDLLRQQRREPSHAADSLETAHESATLEPSPPQRVINQEEEAILWRSMERIPQIYREPLVLFYREDQSIQRVAENLELSEDAVKQRLSRGRKLLHEEVTGFIEGALRASAPGKAFTVGVLMALPAFTISASAVTLGASAAKGSAAAKTVGMLGLFGTILSPLLGFFGTWVGYRMSLDVAQSKAERDYIKSFYGRLAGCILGFFVLYAAVMVWARPILKTHSLLFNALVIGLTLAYIISILALTIWGFKKRRIFLGQLKSDGSAADPVKPTWEYRSKLNLLGLPLIHVRIGGGMVAQQKVVKAWIAVGDCAAGVLFAFGGIAIAPISIGGMAIGLLPFGGCALGLLALGGLSIGVWSFGGLAVGWQAFGGCAIAWNAAFGGVAIAHDFALGGIAQAVQANNKIAAELIQPHPFFKNAQIAFRYLAWMNLAWIIPMLFWWRMAARERRTSNRG